MCAAVQAQTPPAVFKADPQQGRQEAIFASDPFAVATRPTTPDRPTFRLESTPGSSSPFRVILAKDEPRTPLEDRADVETVKRYMQNLVEGGRLVAQIEQFAEKDDLSPSQRLEVLGLGKKAIAELKKQLTAIDKLGCVKSLSPEERVEVAKLASNLATEELGAAKAALKAGDADKAKIHAVAAEILASFIKGAFPELKLPDISTSPQPQPKEKAEPKKTAPNPKSFT